MRRIVRTLQQPEIDMSDDQTSKAIERATRCYEAAIDVCAKMRAGNIEPTAEACQRIGDSILNHIEHVETPWGDVGSGNDEDDDGGTVTDLSLGGYSGYGGKGVA